jgi:hypothetical protein
MVGFFFEGFSLKKIFSGIKKFCGQMKKKIFLLENI